MADYIAEARNVHISPRKVRLVADSVSDMTLMSVLSHLSLIRKRAAQPLKKAIESAVANAVNNFKIEKDSLRIKEILINEGIRYKRYHFAGRGRTRPYVKRTSHIRVVLTESLKSEAQNPKSETNLNKTKIQNIKTKRKEKTR